MARLAASLRMPSQKRKSCRPVVKRDRRPAVGSMAVCAGRPVAALMNIVLCVTAIALARQGRADPGRMTGLTSDRCVSSCQREAGACVVERFNRPFQFRMTGGAIPAQLALMRIVFRVAGNARRRQSLPGLVCVAGQTVRVGVRALQRKTRRGMIEPNCLPVDGDVTGCAGRSKAALMRLIRLVTAHAIQRGLGEFDAGAMALSAIHTQVPAV